MKKRVMLFLLFSVFARICFAKETEENEEQPVESRMDLSFYTSTSGQMQVNFIPQWKFPVLRGNSPLTSENNVVLKLDAFLSPIWAGVTLQFDLAAFFPGDWNHVVMQFYNRIEYLAYSKAKGDDLWYYLGDDGINMNAVRHKFELFAGYAMPVFVDLIGYQLEGALPFYNVEAGGSVRDRGYSLNNALIVNFRISRQFSIMTITSVTNGFKDPITSAYEREWKFDCVQLIATWRIK